MVAISVGRTDGRTNESSGRTARKKHNAFADIVGWLRHKKSYVTPTAHVRGGYILPRGSLIDARGVPHICYCSSPQRQTHTNRT